MFECYIFFLFSFPAPEATTTEGKPNLDATPVVLDFYFCVCSLLAFVFVSLLVFSILHFVLFSFQAPEVTTREGNSVVDVAPIVLCFLNLLVFVFVSLLLIFSVILLLFSFTAPEVTTTEGKSNLDATPIVPDCYVCN